MWQLVSYAQESKYHLTLMHVQWTNMHAFGSAGTSRNEIETTNVESVNRVREASGTVQLVSYKMRQLSAIAN